VHERGASETVPGGVVLITAAGAQRMATLQLAVLTPSSVSLRPASILRATGVGASRTQRFVAAAHDHV